MRYLHLLGLPSPSYLIVGMAIVGKNFSLMTDFRDVYSSGETSLQVPSCLRPLYSSAYD